MPILIGKPNERLQKEIDSLSEMVSRKILIMGMLSLALAFILSACGGGNEETSPEENTDANTEESLEVDQPEDTNTNTDESTEMDHSNMNHSGSGDVPENLKESENPTYVVGSKAIIQEGHMEGMEGVTAVIDSAEETTIYMIDFTPTTGGEKVKNHKWVTESELSPVE